MNRHDPNNSEQSWYPPTHRYMAPDGRLFNIVTQWTVNLRSPHRNPDMGWYARYAEMTGIGYTTCSDSHRRLFATETEAIADAVRHILDTIVFEPIVTVQLPADREG